MSQAILVCHREEDAPRAAGAYALTSIAGYDGYVACWDAKYFYLAKRPFQLDPTLKTLFVTPNFPSYPSGHSTLSNVIDGVLNYLFPADSADVTESVHETGEARMWAGIHFRSDIIAGEKVGGDVANAVITDAKAGGSSE